MSFVHPNDLFSYFASLLLIWRRLFVTCTTLVPHLPHPFPGANIFVTIYTKALRQPYFLYLFQYRKPNHLFIISKQCLHSYLKRFLAQIVTSLLLQHRVVFTKSYLRSGSVVVFFKWSCRKTIFQKKFQCLV